MSCPRGEDIGAVHPRERPPAHAVEAHVYVHHRGHGLTGGGRSRNRRRIGVELRGWVRLEDGSDDEEQGAHADGRNEEGELAPEEFDEEEDEDGCGYDFDDTVDSGGEQRVLVSCVTDLQDNWGVNEES